MKHLPALILALMILSSYQVAGAAAQPLPLFEAEELEFSLCDSLMIFDGILVFSNPHAQNIRQAIYFPIPHDSIQLAPEQIQVKDTYNQQDPEYHSDESGLWFVLDMDAESVKEIRIRYQQKLKRKRARYILLTANTWPKALGYAAYTIHLPEAAAITHYPFAKEQIIHQEEASYRWEFYDYRPAEDFLIEWE